jgi:hypothetical protein
MNKLKVLKVLGSQENESYELYADGLEALGKYT